jgi:Tol biopolymer transport system component
MSYRYATVLSLLLTIPVVSTSGQSTGQSAAQVSPNPPATPWDTTKARGKTREIDFDTSEGTWMSVSLSPDEKYVLFDLLAHIYRVPTGGGNAECLTQNSGVALNFQPRYSPDGKYIAFISDRGGQNNLWVMDADGSNPRAVFDDKDIRATQPTWTPDSQYILIVRDSVASGLEPRPPSGVWMYHRDGGKGLELIGKESRDAEWPSVSSDGRYVYFHYAAGEPSSYAGHDDITQGSYQIKRLDLRTGNVVDITAGTGEQQYRASNGGAIAPEISPDGRWLAFARRIPNGTISYKGHKFGPRTALWLRDLQSGAEHVAMDPIEVDMAEAGKTSRSLPGYNWAADSKSLVVPQGGKIHRLWIDSGKVDTIPFVAHVHRTISEMALAVRRVTDEAFSVKFARWQTGSPDGKRLAFQALGRIWIMDLPNGTARRLTAASFSPLEYSPAWSHDGRWIAFTSWDEKTGGSVWKVPAAGGAPQPLTKEAGEYVNTVWSPDDSYVVVSRGSGPTFQGQGWIANPWYDLVQIPAAGGKPANSVRVPRLPGRLERNSIVQASFGPEGRIFFPEFFLQKREGDRERVMTNFVSVKPDGTDRRVHMVFPYADEVAPSPDGKRVAFQEGDNIYVMPFPVIGLAGKAPVMDRKNAALPVKQVSLEGGNFPQWRDAQTLEYGSANRYFVYHVEGAKTDTTELHLTAERNIPKGSIALTGARIITLENQKIIAEGTIVIRGSRISCVGECSTSGVDRIIDVKGKTIIPGLIDMHAHHFSEYSGMTPLHAYENATYLAYGVTSTLDPAAWGANVFPVAELTDAGQMIGPRTFSTGDPLYNGDGPRNNELSSYEVTEQNIRRLASYGVITLKQYLQSRREQHQWIAEIARKLQLNVTAEDDTLEYNLGMVMDGQTGFEHPISNVPLYQDVTQFMGMAHFFYSPTAIVGGAGPWNEEYFFQSSEWFKNEKLLRWTPWSEVLPHSRRRILRPETDYSYPLIAQGLTDTIHFGGHGALGGHGQQNGIGTQWELWMYASALGPMGALEVGTMDGARYLGMEQDLGSIAVGKLADLDVLNKNPLDDIHNSADIEYVMKGGVLYDGNTLDELWPEKKPFGENYWVYPPALLDDTRPTDYWEHR